MRRRFAASCFNDESPAVAFPDAVAQMRKWIRTLLQLSPAEMLVSDRFLFVTCGNWDVMTAIPRQCSKPVPGTVDVGTQQLLFSRWCNLKEAFREHYKLPIAVAPTGMRGMLNRLRITLAGQHHLAMDDVSNLAKILRILIGEGCKIGSTGQARGFQVPFGLGPRPMPSCFGGCLGRVGPHAKGKG